MCARFVIYEDRAGRWRWRLVAQNGRIIADCGGSYSRHQRAQTAVERVTEVAPTADRLDYGQPHFEVFEDREDNYRWRLVARNGRIIADSGQGYADRSGATAGIDTVRQHLADERGIETYEDNAGEYRWRLVASNGRIIADGSQGYSSRNAVSDAVDRVTRDGPHADQLDTGRPHFEVYEDRGGKWRWRLIARNGRIIADSGQGYAKKSGAIRGLSRVQAACGGTPEKAVDLDPDSAPATTEADATLETALGIEAVHSDGTHQTEQMLSAGQPVPAIDERSDFTTIEDDQTELEIRILAGTSDDPDANDRLETFFIEDLPPRPVGDPAFRVQFSVDETGTLFAEAVDLETGNKAATTTTVPLADG